MVTIAHNFYPSGCSCPNKRYCHVPAVWIWWLEDPDEYEDYYSAENSHDIGLVNLPVNLGGKFTRVY